MKILSIALTAVALAGGAAAASGADDSRVTVTFAKPETYTDLRASCVSRAADTQALLAELAGFLKAAAAPLLPADRRLEVTVTNVDMAGEFEPWRRPGLCDLRVVKDVYPPRIDLSFRLLGPGGAAAREGRRQLRDASYLDGAAPVTADHLRYERALLRDWLRRELREGSGS